MKPVNRIFAFFVAVVLATSIGCASTSTKESSGEYIEAFGICDGIKSNVVNG
jgi:hypothetical protein